MMSSFFMSLCYLNKIPIRPVNFGFYVEHLLLSLRALSGMSTLITDWRRDGSIRHIIEDYYFMFYVVFPPFSGEFRYFWNWYIRFIIYIREEKDLINMGGCDFLFYYFVFIDVSWRET